jgi:hypothetical protein
MMTFDEWQRVLLREHILSKPRTTIVLVQAGFSEHLNQDSLTIQEMH